MIDAQLAIAVIEFRVKNLRHKIKEFREVKKVK